MSKILRHQQEKPDRSRTSKTVVKVLESKSDGLDSQKGDPMILVMDPTKRDKYWENRDEKMTWQLNDTLRQLKLLENQLKELEATRSQAPPQEQPRVEREIQQTQRAIRYSRANSVLLRNHLQISDDKEPGEITAMFRSINRDVDNLCRDITESLASLHQSRGGTKLNTSSDVRDMPGVKRALHGTTGVSSGLIESWAGNGRPIDEFMDFSLQFLFNSELCQLIFDPFHPLMTREESDSISQIYNNVRRQDPQVMSGRWRVSTYLAQQSKYSPSIHQQWLDRLQIGLVNNILLPFLVAVYGDSAQLSSEHEGSIASVTRKAYRWNQMIKTEVVLLDFEPMMFPNGARYNSDMMAPLDSRLGPAQAEPIISTVCLGLRSSEAAGGGLPPIKVWQEKVKVLTSDYFERS